MESDQNTGPQTDTGGHLRAPVVSLPFAGRDDVVQQLRGKVRVAQAGQGTVIVIEGVGGIGKSRLLSELVEELPGTVMLIPCRGSSQRTRDPLDLIIRHLLDIDMTASALEQRDAVRKQLGTLKLGDVTTEVLEFLRLPSTRDDDPRLKQMGSPSDTIIMSGDVRLPEVLYRLVQSWVELNTDRLPLVILLDDYDAASELTAFALTDLLQYAGSLPVAVFISLTPDTLQPGVVGVTGDDVLHLAPLQRQDTAAAFREALGARLLSAALEARLWEFTGGYPLRMHVLVNFLVDSKMVGSDDQNGLVDIPGDGELPGFTEMVGARLAMMPDRQRKTLKAAAVLGSGFRIGALSVLRTEDNRSPREMDVIADLTALVEAGWLEAAGAGRRSVYRFVNRDIRELVYRAVDVDNRSAMHRRAGDYYAIPATGGRLRTGLAVEHYEKAGEVERALAALDIALDEARKAGDRNLLVSLYRKGAGIAGGDQKMTGRQAELAESLGDMYARIGYFPEAAGAYRDLAPTDMPLPLRAKLALSLLAVSPEKAVRVIDGVLSSAPAQSDLYWRLVAGRSWGYALSDDGYMAVRTSRDALADLQNTAGLGDARSLLRGVLGMALYYTAETERERIDAAVHIESARAGWGARGESTAVMLMNKVLIGTPRDEITVAWLQYLLAPLLTPDDSAPG